MCLNFGRWQFVVRTIPAVTESFQPLEDVIHCFILPLLVETSSPNYTLRDLFALPHCLGGLGIFNLNNVIVSILNLSISLKLWLNTLGIMRMVLTWA